MNLVFGFSHQVQLTYFDKCDDLSIVLLSVKLHKAITDAADTEVKEEVVSIGV